MKLKYTAYQRRESNTDVEGGILFYVTTVIGSIEDTDTGVPLPISVTGSPYHNLFMLDYRAKDFHTPSSVFLYESAPLRVLTPEDMGVSPGGTGNGLPTVPDLTRIYYESYTDLDPTGGGAMSKGSTLLLSDPTHMNPHGVDDKGAYLSNILVTVSGTLADADQAALDAIQQITIFQRRFNELAAGFSTTGPGATPSGYETYPIGS